ncbi:MAG TPA: DUF4870 domain-containing protein [Gemmataceae bacterium]|nr:DUF4870 domain-containing protein [Gemmataceae bacterium]
MSLDDAENVRPAEDELEEVSSLPLRKPSLDADARQWAMFCHLSALLGLMAGGLTFLGPLVCWLAKRDSSPFVDYHGKEALNFHLNMLIYGLVLAGITAATCFVAIVVTGPLLAVLGVYAIVMPIIAGIKANEGDYYRYPLTFRLIK